MLATRRRRIKSELTQHPFLYVDRLLEKPRNTTSGVFRFLGLVLAPPHRDPMPFRDLSTQARKFIAQIALFDGLSVTTRKAHIPNIFWSFIPYFSNKNR